MVFCHGLLGFDTVTLGPSIALLRVAHWRGIKDALKANGTEVLITRVPATSFPVDRAKVLEQKNVNDSCTTASRKTTACGANDKNR